jgi:hypothetical protein
VKSTLERRVKSSEVVRAEPNSVEHRLAALTHRRGARPLRAVRGKEAVLPARASKTCCRPRRARGCSTSGRTAHSQWSRVNRRVSRPWLALRSRTSTAGGVRGGQPSTIDRAGGRDSSERTSHRAAAPRHTHGSSSKTSTNLSSDRGVRRSPCKQVTRRPRAAASTLSARARVFTAYTSVSSWSPQQGPAQFAEDNATPATCPRG